MFSIWRRGNHGSSGTGEVVWTKWTWFYIGLAVVLHMLVFAGVLYWTLSSWALQGNQRYVGWTQTSCIVRSATASSPFVVDLFPDYTGWRAEIEVFNTYLRPQDRPSDFDPKNVTVAFRSGYEKYNYTRQSAEEFAARFAADEEYRCWYNQTAHASVKMTSDVNESEAFSQGSITAQVAVSTTTCVLVGMSVFVFLGFTGFWILQRSEYSLYEHNARRRGSDTRRKELPGKFSQLPPSEMSEWENWCELQCFICLGGFCSDALSVDGPGDAETRVCVVKLPECDHLFHHKCIDEWARLGHDECPVCRRTMWNV